MSTLNESFSKHMSNICFRLPDVQFQGENSIGCLALGIEKHTSFQAFLGGVAHIGLFEHEDPELQGLPISSWNLSYWVAVRVSFSISIGQYLPISGG